MDSDEGSIVLGWLTRLTAVIGVLGLLSFDGISLVRAEFSAADHASQAASAAADTYRTTKNAQAAYDAAVALVTANGETIDPKSFVVTPATGHVALELEATATTVWMHKIGPLRKFTVVNADGEGNPPA